MKKITLFFVVALALAVALTGCQGIEINPQSETALIKTAGRILGNELGKAYPEIIEPGLLLCETVGTVNDHGQLVKLSDQATGYLAEKLKTDPVLLASLNDLTALISITPDEDADIWVERIKVAAGAIYEGLEMARGAVTS